LGGKSNGSEENGTIDSISAMDRVVNYRRKVGCVAADAIDRRASISTIRHCGSNLPSSSDSALPCWQGQSPQIGIIGADHGCRVIPTHLFLLLTASYLLYIN